MLFTVLLPAFLLSGCWNLTEPEDISMVTVLGINLTADNQYEVVAQDQTLTPGGQQIQKSNWTFDIHKSTGPSIDEAIQNNSRINPEKIYLSHTKAIIISEELASQQGIGPVVDFLSRNPEIRQKTLFLISKKGEFDKVFLPNAKLSIDSGKLIEKIVKNRSVNSMILESRLKDFLELYYDSYKTPYALGVGSIQTFMDNASIEQDYENVGANTYDIDVGGIAVFKRDKMVGWLTSDESRGFLWVKGKVEGGNIHVMYEGKRIDLKVLKTKSRIRPLVENRQMKIDVNIQVDTVIRTSYADIDFDAKSVTDKISQILNKQVAQEVREALNESKNLSTDCFGFGNCFFENYPNYWKQNESHWPDNYAQINIAIQVKSNIQNIGLVKKFAQPVR